MPTLVVEVYQADAQKPSRSMVDVVYHLGVTPKEYIGSPEEKSKTSYHSIKVGISTSQYTVWNKIDYQKSHAWLKILYEYAKRHITEKLLIGNLAEYEVLELYSYNTPATCPFDPERIPAQGNWKFEVELPNPKKFVEGEEEILMRGIVRSFIAQMGQTLIIHNNWKQSDATSIEVRGLKNRSKGSRKDVFQFDQRFGIERGTVIQSKGTQDFWLVEDTEDHIIQDEFDYLTAYVRKVTQEGNLIGTSNNSTRSVIVNNHGPVFGQQIGNNNMQTVTTGQDINEIINSLIELLNSSSIPELDKGDAEEALQSISNLAKKEKSEGVLERVSGRLATFTSIISSSQTIYEQAQPLVTALKAYFGIA